MKLTLLTLVRDEGSRWLPSLLHQWREYADEIIAVDDDSTDDTREILTAARAAIHHRREAPAWGAESPARAELYAAGCASDADWLLWLDADMGFTRSPRALIEAADAAGADAVAFRLYDIWADDGWDLWYREDAYWRAHQVPRVWCIRNPRSDAGAEWPARGLHCGHLPQNIGFSRVITAPKDIALLHYAYSRNDERIKKHAAYMSKAELLTPHERAHAETIIESCRLLPLDGADLDYRVTYGR